MQVAYQGIDQDFMSTAFFDYCKVREGYKLTVYKDNIGRLTVGIGHLVQSGDNLQLGDTISDAQALLFFQQDYERLSIENSISENPDYSMNQMLAIGHFIWMHGQGSSGDIGYADSNYRQYMLEVSPDAPFGTTMPTEADMQAYMAANWDRSNPGDQHENSEDVHVAYSTVPWQPGF